MARGLYVGMVVGVLALTGGSRVLAGPSPIDRGAEVKFTTGGSLDESTVSAEGLGVRVSKRVGRDTVRIRIEAAKDIVDLEAKSGGTVRLSRRRPVPRTLSALSLADHSRLAAACRSSELARPAT